MKKMTSTPLTAAVREVSDDGMRRRLLHLGKTNEWSNWSEELCCPVYCGNNLDLLYLLLWCFHVKT